MLAFAMILGGVIGATIGALYIHAFLDWLLGPVDKI